MGRAVGLSGPRITEIGESQRQGMLERREEEARRLLDGVDRGEMVVVLDERAMQLTSREFAARLAKERDRGGTSCTFLIGGPDGHGDAVLKHAKWSLSLSKMTLPHGLARILLLEQIFRAVTLLSGHPYHRD
jgi:23S rRNA (pseudouridine1915-N3)-methyltransferase